LALLQKAKNKRDRWKIICKYFDKFFGGDAIAGTSHLHDHLILSPIKWPQTNMAKSVRKVGK